MTLGEIHEWADRISRDAPPRPPPDQPGARLHELVDEIRAIQDAWRPPDLPDVAPLNDTDEFRRWMDAQAEHCRANPESGGQAEVLLGELLSRFRTASNGARTSLSPAVRASIDGQFLCSVQAASTDAVRRGDASLLDDAFLALGLAAPGKDIRDVLVCNVLPGRACKLLNVDPKQASRPAMALLGPVGVYVVRGAARHMGRGDLHSMGWQARGRGESFEFFQKPWS